MNTPHKHAEVIKAWADGKRIQRKEFDGNWVNCRLASECSGNAPLFANDIDYRIKPEAIKYRKYIAKNLQGTVFVGCWILNEYFKTEQSVENFYPGRFVRWIDNDWVEEEL